MNKDIKEELKQNSSLFKPSEPVFNQIKSERKKIQPKQSSRAKQRHESRNLNTNRNVAQPAKINSKIVDELVKNYPGYFP